MAEASQTSADIVDLLTADHDTVRSLLKEIKQEKGEDRTPLLEELHKEFMVHSDVEERIVYPAYKEAADKREASVDVAESLDEHKMAKQVLEEMLELDVGSIQFDAKLKLIEEQIEHHAQEEEKSMFPEMREVIEEEELRNLAKQVRKAKKEIEKEYE